MNQGKIISESDANLIETILRITTTLVDIDQNYTEEGIVENIEKARKIAPCSDEIAEEVKTRILANYGHKLDLGTMIVSEHNDWFMSRTKELKMSYTSRNRKYLIDDKRMSPAVVSKLDDITNDIMDGLGDPTSSNFKRRGLVMGDVQSGKTSVYTILSCKAVDTGYKLIILLTGTLEILRQQTQFRMDEGLVGKDSEKLINHNNVPIGVGKHGDGAFLVLTSTGSDFKKSIATAMNIPIENLNTPVLLVLKKNKSVLNNLYEWLKSNTQGNILSPLLLIDDEADNASINTSVDSITAINSCIRNILSLFLKSTYVGFTATPYANIFIDSDEKDDLYPRDFIYCLSSPSNYIGPSRMYSEGGRYSYILKTIPIKDEEVGLPEIPYKHSKEFQVTSMPPSLEEAICCFLVSCAIRDMKGQTRSHMSMMVNVSRFTEVQESAKDLISQFMFQMRDAVITFSHLPEEQAVKNPYISKLKSAWASNYRDLGYDWVTIQNRLESAISPITVRSVNQKNGPKNLNYAANPGGLRVIAVGGNSLSRGLTLEGLCVSYFYRRSQSYDTLMQMGRWFGYRDGYDELCRVWMTQESRDWYLDISEATDELKFEFRKMRDANKTPEQFGFRVRDDINGLMITARNKMRHAGEDYIVKRVDGKLLWTSHVYVREAEVRSNLEALVDLIKALCGQKHPFHNEFTDNWAWSDIDAFAVADFLEKYRNPDENMLFDPEAIVRMIRNGDVSTRWDVAIQHGSGTDVLFNEFGIGTNAVERNNYTPKNRNTVVRFNSSALITPDNLREGLLESRIAEGLADKAEFRKEVDRLRESYFNTLDAEKKDGCETYKDMKNYPAITYLQTENRNPLLLIYPLKLGIGTGSEETVDNRRAVSAELESKDLHPVGVAIGFPGDPKTSGSEKAMIRYRTTTVYKKFGNEDLDEPED